VPEGFVSTAVLEGTRERRTARRAPEPRQRKLSDDLRRTGRDLAAALPPDQSGEETLRSRSAEPAPSGSVAACGERTTRFGGDRLTLEAQLERIWEGLLAAGAAECPACGGTMEWREPLAACARCGSTLS
jgi:hypothetical protein